jgi:asparagine synthase (glutamine-hydrolysing)
VSWLDQPAFEPQRAGLARWAVVADSRDPGALQVLHGQEVELEEFDGVTVAAAGIAPRWCLATLGQALRDAGLGGTDTVAAIQRAQAPAQRDLARPHAWVAAVPKLNAFVAARDPLGRLPLFWAQADGRLVISADSERVTELAGLDGSPNPGALIAQLTGLWPDATEAYVQGLERVPSGEALIVAGERRLIVRHWDPASPAAPGSQPLDRAEFRAALLGAVEDAVGDGRVAIYLSGGLDSVGVAALATRAAREAGQEPPRALSVAFTDSDFDEVATQVAVAKRLGLPHEIADHIELCDGDPIAAVLELATTFPAPPQNVFLPAFLRLGSPAVAEDCVAVLTGTGGDEWLGVTPLLAADLFVRGDLRGVWRLFRTVYRSNPIGRLSAARNIFWRHGARTVLGMALLANDRFRFARAATARLAARRRAEIPEWVAPGAEGEAEIDRRAELFAALRPRRLGARYADETRQGLVHPIVSTESEEHVEHGRRLGAPLRHPYLDPALAKLLCAARPSDLTEESRSKAPLRALVDEAFPGLGFGAQRKPVAAHYVADLMTSMGLEALRRLEGPLALAQLGVVDPAGVGAMADALAGGRADWLAPYRLWEVLCLEAWARPRMG